MITPVIPYVGGLISKKSQLNFFLSQFRAKFLMHVVKRFVWLACFVYTCIKVCSSIVINIDI